MLAEASRGVTNTVQRMHRAIARRSFSLLGGTAEPAKLMHDGIAELVYTSVHAGITAGGAVAELAAHAAGASRPRGSLLESSAGSAAAGVLGGAFGERAYTAPAAMTVRVNSAAVPITPTSLAEAYPDASGHIVVFLHGLIETERWWYPRPARGGEPARADFGTRLAKDIDCTPLFLRYNTGKHISTNGHELDEMLSAVVEAWPTRVTRMSIVGHSMGGLVARSAVHDAALGSKPWVHRLAHLVCLGSPHNGAPLELAAHVATWALGRFPESAPLGDLLRLRSDGIKDLRYGYVQNEQWTGRDADALLLRSPRAECRVPDGARLHFVSATIGRDQHGVLARFLGDALVTPASAGDESQDALRHWVGGVHHFGLLHHDEVYRQLLAWLCAAE